MRKTLRILAFYNCFPWLEAIVEKKRLERLSLKIRLLEGVDDLEKALLEVPHEELHDWSQWYGGVDIDYFLVFGNQEVMDLKVPPTITFNVPYHIEERNKVGETVLATLARRNLTASLKEAEFLARRYYCQDNDISWAEVWIYPLTQEKVDSALAKAESTLALEEEKLSSEEEIRLLEKEIAELKDKVARRNRQIQDLRQRLGEKA